MVRILIVEDATDLQYLYRTAFEKAGYTVTVASTGGNAVEEVSKQSFAAVILDLLMLGMSGFDVLREYNFKRNSPKTRIVVVTNLDSPNMFEKAKAYGVDRYLTKADYTPKQVVAVVAELLSSAA